MALRAHHFEWVAALARRGDVHAEARPRGVMSPPLDRLSPSSRREQTGETRLDEARLSRPRRLSGDHAPRPATPSFSARRDENDDATEPTKTMQPLLTLP
jgi:hypothetical protein